MSWKNATDTGRAARRKMPRWESRCRHDLRQTTSDADTRKEIQIMARLPYATPAQLADLLRQSGLPENTPATNAFFTLAHTPAVGARALQLILALLTETDLDPKLRELVILRVAQRCDGTYPWVQHVAIARSVGVSKLQIAALERGETPGDLFEDRERAT